MTLVPGDLDVASRGRRCAAGAVDAVLMLAWMAVIAGAAAVFPGGWPRIQARLESERVRRSMDTWGLIVTVASRNVQSPGSVVFDLRRVDLRTGGPVSIRSTLIRQYATLGWSRLIKRLVGPYDRRQQERLEAVEPQVEAARREHPDDPQAVIRATSELYAAQRIHVGRPCLVRLVAGLVPQLAFLWSPRRQSIPDWLAGIVVVRDRR